MKELTDRIHSVDKTLDCKLGLCQDRFKFYLPKDDFFDFKIKVQEQYTPAKDFKAMNERID